jgi:hypothetical protein
VQIQRAGLLILMVISCSSLAEAVTELFHIRIRGIAFESRSDKEEIPTLRKPMRVALPFIRHVSDFALRTLTYLERVKKETRTRF